MKYEYTIIHVIEDGINDEFQILFSYDPEVDVEPRFYMSKGRYFILHGLSLKEIIYAAIMQDNFVRSLDGELNKEITKEDNHIYFNINDYALIKNLENNYFKNSLNYEPNKELKTR